MSLVNLITNLRSLKQILNKTADIWASLRGEISKYDVICLATIELFYHQTFTFITENFYDLRTHGSTALFSNDKNKANSESEEYNTESTAYKLAKYLNNITTGNDKHNIYVVAKCSFLINLICYIFPSKSLHKLYDYDNNQYHDCQLMTSKNINYFHRYTIMNILEMPVDSDQNIIQLIDKIENLNDFKNLAQRLLSNTKFRNSFITFANKKLNFPVIKELFISIIGEQTENSSTNQALTKLIKELPVNLYSGNPRDYICNNNKCFMNEDKYNIVISLYPELITKSFFTNSGITSLINLNFFDFINYTEFELEDYADLYIKTIINPIRNHFNNDLDSFITFINTKNYQSLKNLIMLDILVNDKIFDKNDISKNQKIQIEPITIFLNQIFSILLKQASYKKELYLQLIPFFSNSTFLTHQICPFIKEFTIFNYETLNKAHNFYSNISKEYLMTFGITDINDQTAIKSNTSKLLEKLEKLINTINNN